MAYFFSPSFIFTWNSSEFLHMFFSLPLVNVYFQMPSPLGWPFNELLTVGYFGYDF